MADKTLGLNPWTRIWTSPRETIRSIVNFNPKYRFIILSFLHGLPTLFYAAQDLSMGNTYSIFGIILTAIVLATFIGMLTITIGSALFLWTGRWIGGTATYYPIRAAVSWSNVPNIIIILTWAISIYFFREQLFLKGFQQTDFIGPAFTVMAINLVVQTVMSIWSFVILVKGLAEVQGFSAWKGLLNALIPFFMIAILIWVITSIATAFLR